MAEFIPGIELCRAFFDEAIAPIIEAEFPTLDYSAGLIGAGSEVLGFDTQMSTDHDWGPRAMLFLREEDFASRRDRVVDELRLRLPTTFRGYSTSFGEPDESDNGTRQLEPAMAGQVRHRAEVLTFSGFVRESLGFDIALPLAPADWLTFPEQKLRAITGGAIFRDDIGVQALRERFAYYPRDVWLYQLAACWTRIGQEEHLMGRAGEAGDEIGSALIASRLVRDLMRLCFLYERQYAPYAKWFGSAFALLASGAVLMPIITRVLRANNWRERQDALVLAYEIVANLHRDAAITKPLPIEARQFFDRPFQVIAQHGFPDAIKAVIVDADTKRLADKPVIGGIDLISDNTDVLCDISRRDGIRSLYA